MKSVSMVGLVLCTTALVGGCDFFGSGEAKKVEMIKLEEQKAERVATEKKDAAVALRAYIQGKCALATNDAVIVTAALAVPNEDAKRLEKAVAAIMSDEKGERTVAERLGDVLNDPTVNEIAHKYLSTGFSVQREAFLARVADAEREVRVYQEAMAKADRAFEERVSGTTQWQTSTKDTHKDEIKRLQAEIKKLESRLHSIRHGLVGNQFSQTTRNERIADLEQEIYTKRNQIDKLRDPRNRQNNENRAVDEQVRVRDRALSVRESEKRGIDRRLKPKTNILQVVQETEMQTLGVLRAKIQDQKEMLAAELVSIGRKVRLAQEYLLEVGVCDEVGLKQLKSRVDANLSLGTGKK